MSNIIITYKKSHYKMFTLFKNIVVNKKNTFNLLKNNN